MLQFYDKVKLDEALLIVLCLLNPFDHDFDNLLGAYWLTLLVLIFLQSSRHMNEYVEVIL